MGREQIFGCLNRNITIEATFLLPQPLGKIHYVYGEFAGDFAHVA